MTTSEEQAALVALLRLTDGHWQRSVSLVQQTGSAIEVLQRELGSHGAQVTLLPEDPLPLVERAAAEIDRWRRDGVQLLTVLDDGYPANLREVKDRPPIIFVAGGVKATDRRSIAIIGARRASPLGLERAAAISAQFVSAGVVVVSGLAAGIDTTAHVAALEHGGRTLAVLGTGLNHCYPPQNAGLQRTIADRCAVISQFWPDAPPHRRSFPMRNAVMSGLTQGSVLVEASERSGARVQARLALAHGRPVFLLESLLSQGWARDLASRAGVFVVDGAQQVIEVIEGRSRCRT